MENRKKKNQIKFFYQILSDIKNNIDTLVRELYENRDNLEEFSTSKPVILKSKYPDLKKLKIIDRKEKWFITDIGNELLDAYANDNKDEYSKTIASILGTYNYGGFRPYAVLCKFLYMKFGTTKYLDRDEVIDFLCLPINEAMYFISNNQHSELKHLSKAELIEAPRPYSYWVNYLKNAGLIEEDENGLKLTNNIEEFLSIFFTDVENIPRYKKDGSMAKYRIMSRGIDQVSFRSELLEAYGGKCALTGKYFIMKNNNLLEAAHIIPVSHGGSYDVTNGILMTADLHKAFDVGAFTFDDEYNLIVYPEVEEKEYLPKSMKAEFLPENKEQHPSLVSINYHRQYIYGVGILNSKK